MPAAAQLELFFGGSFITISFFTGEQVYVHHNFVVCILIDMLKYMLLLNQYRYFFPCI